MPDSELAHSLRLQYMQVEDGNSCEDSCAANSEDQFDRLVQLWRRRYLRRAPSLTYGACMGTQKLGPWLRLTELDSNAQGCTTSSI